MRTPIIACIVAATFSTSLAVNNAIAQNAAPAANANPDALFIWSSGIDGMLVDPKDKGLADALKMLDERLAELPRELDEDDMPGPALELALQLLMGPMTLRAGMMPDADPNAGPPFYAQVNFLPGDAAKAEAAAGRFTAILRQVGAPPADPAPNLPGMNMMDADGVPLFFGTIKTDGGPAFALALNRADASAPKIDTTGLPKDVKPAFAFGLDARQLQPVLQMLMAQAGPEAAGVQMQLESMGLYGPNASTINVVSGYGADRSHMAMRYTNYRQIMEKSKVLSAKRVTADVLKRIPADAHWAQATATKLSGLGDMINMWAKTAAEQQGQGDVDPMAMIEQQTGVNPQRDIFAHLGDYCGIYTSDTTGGGGLLSAVTFMEVTKPDELAKTMARVNGMINQLAQQHARGYVRIAERKSDDLTVTTLTFPGLPVPLEPSWTIADGWLYAAASPQALLAGVKHARTGKGSLADNARFKEMGGGSLEDAIQVTFLDTPSLVSGGYGLVSLGAAALANAVRSPTDPERDPGLVMPSYQRLMEGAKAAVYVSRLQGDDLLMIGQGDRSILVNACGAVGMLGGSTGAVVMGALAAGVMLPAIGKAKDRAEDTRAATNLRLIATAAVIYSAEENDKTPQGLDVLVEREYIDAEVLSSPHGPVSDGDGDYWICTKFATFSKIEFPDQQVYAYDRAMLEGGETVAVAYFDGHVETMSVDDFVQMLQEEPNAGIDFNLP